jgi:hypothetical protein
VPHSSAHIRPSASARCVQSSALRARSSVGERSLHTREVAGSKPAAPMMRSPATAGFSHTEAASSPSRSSEFVPTSCPGRRCRCRRRRAARGPGPRRRSPDGPRCGRSSTRSAHPPRQRDDAHAGRRAPRRRGVAHVIDAPVRNAAGVDCGQPLARTEVVDVDPSTLCCGEHDALAPGQLRERRPTGPHRPDGRRRPPARLLSARSREHCRSDRSCRQSARSRARGRFRRRTRALRQ